MAWGEHEVVEVKKVGTNDEWEWAIITGAEIDSSFGLKMYPIWTPFGYRYEYTTNIRAFTGTDLDKNRHKDRWDSERNRQPGRGGSRKLSRRHKRKIRKTKRRR
jgi:hypothetical protein